MNATTTCQGAVPEDSEACPRCVFDLAFERSETQPLPQLGRGPDSKAASPARPRSWRA